MYIGIKNAINNRQDKETPTMNVPKCNIKVSIIIILI